MRSCSTDPPDLHDLPRPAGVDPLGAISRETSRFESISLAELGAAALMDRIDTKFLVPADTFARLVHRLPDAYRLLAIEGRSLPRYTTRYYDSPELRLYHDHHAGRTPRIKVRVRTYEATGDRFLEVKQKTNKGRTRKLRVWLPDGSSDPLERLEEEGYFGLGNSLAPLALRPAIIVEYRRATLVSSYGPERLTLDFELTFARNGRVRTFPRVVVAEVKQERRAPSLFLEAMRRNGVREGALSKYCLGVASLDATAKRNRFKAVLRRLERLGDGSVVADHLEPARAHG